MMEFLASTNKDVDRVRLSKKKRRNCGDDPREDSHISSISNDMMLSMTKKDLDMFLKLRDALDKFNGQHQYYCDILQECEPGCIAYELLHLTSPHLALPGLYIMPDDGFNCKCDDELLVRKAFTLSRRTPVDLEIISGNVTSAGIMALAARSPCKFGYINITNVLNLTDEAFMALTLSHKDTLYDLVVDVAMTQRDGRVSLPTLSYVLDHLVNLRQITISTCSRDYGVSIMQIMVMLSRFPKIVEVNLIFETSAEDLEAILPQCIPHFTHLKVLNFLNKQKSWRLFPHTLARTLDTCPNLKWFEIDGLSHDVSVSELLVHPEVEAAMTRHIECHIDICQMVWPHSCV